LQLTEASEQCGESKWLLQKARPGEKFHFREAFGVAGHEERLYFWLEFDDLPMEVRPSSGGGSQTGLLLTAEMNRS
jgi:hypothetical protein